MLKVITFTIGITVTAAGIEGSDDLSEESKRIVVAVFNRIYVMREELSQLSDKLDEKDGNIAFLEGDFTELERYRVAMLEERIDDASVYERREHCCFPEVVCPLF